MRSVKFWTVLVLSSLIMRKSEFDQAYVPTMQTSMTDRKENTARGKHLLGSLETKTAIALLTSNRCVHGLFSSYQTWGGRAWPPRQCRGTLRAEPASHSRSSCLHAIMCGRVNERARAYMRLCVYCYSTLRTAPHKWKTAQVKTWNWNAQTHTLSQYTLSETCHLLGKNRTKLISHFFFRFVNWDWAIPRGRKSPPYDFSKLGSVCLCVCL